jgi:choline dehydrogenase-like flavoprotein
MQSTNKMGADPETSVVDHRLRAWEHPNLYIVDSSIFPTSVGANPMQTIYTIGKIFADMIPPK